MQVLTERNELKFFGILPRADAVLATAWWLVLLLRGVLPAFFAVAMGTLVYAVQSGAALIVPLTFVGVVFVLLQVLVPLHQALSANLGDRTAAWLYDRLTEACVRPLGIAHLEDPELTSDLTVARDFDLGMTGPPLSMSLDFLSSGLVDMVGGVASALVLAAYSWWAPILLAGAWLSTHWLLRESGVWRDRNTPVVRAAQRDADYAYRLAVEPPAAKELRLFGLATWTMQRFVERRKRLHELQYTATRLRERPLLWSMLLVIGANLVVFWSLANSAADGSLDLGRLVTFAQSAIGSSLIAFGGLNWALDGAAAPAAAVLRLEPRMRSIGALSHPSNQARTVSNQPRPPSNQPRPPSNQPWPPTNEPRPPSNQPRSPSNQPRPPSNQPWPPTDQPRPPSNQPWPPTDQPRPPSNEPWPPTNQPRPLGEAASVASGEGSAHDIRFRNVSFAYPNAASKVLDDFDITIPAGSSLAIVGPNGAGKTTLAKLLCRLYDPQSGSIEVDGVDLRELEPESWRSRVTAVFQDFIRFELPLRDNVAPRGAPDDVVSAALQDAGAGALGQLAGLAGLAGLDTILARGYERGTDLSGGQWQRIALARALCAIRLGAGVVLLDEPTAQLDVRGEAEIFDRILAATRHCTTILISHRFSTVRHADRICVLEHGRVVELGSHDELMRLGGRYRTMFDLQAQRFTATEDEEGIAYDVLA